MVEKATSFDSALKTVKKQLKDKSDSTPNMLIDQMFMMRPTYEAAQYTTPILGLYVCGAGSHPGGGLVGAPGHNAAHEMLR